MAKMSVRERRAARIRAVMPIVEDLARYTGEVDSSWQTRRYDRDNSGLCWLTTPFSVNARGDSALAESNYRVIEKDLSEVAAFGTDFRIDLWVGGSIHTLQVRADDALALRAVDRWVAALADYPVADESDFSEVEWEQNHPSEGECYADEDCPCGTEEGK